ncbi:MAG: hypothetical protein HC777_00550 [Hyphomonadaceae bacterium]|nr:hypothetical protein [Hyphomonadaceae bacterium]
MAFDAALPFWAHRGVDLRHGGPVEQLGLNGEASEAGFKRVRVFARQIYVYSHAHLLGWTAGAGHATAMYEAMLTHAWQGKTQGWAKTLTPANKILDATSDLYDNAFCLFALGWYYRICPRADVLEMMVDTMEVINTTLRHPKLGYWHQVPTSGPRLQNPHMHLLEACLACFEATGLPIFDDVARDVIMLSRRSFMMRTAQLYVSILTMILPLCLGPKARLLSPAINWNGRGFWPARRNC